MDTSGKICNKCSLMKPWEEFHKDRTQKDGYKKICKPCRSDVQKEYRSSKSDDENEELRLASEARIIAIKYLIENHKHEYLIYLRKAKENVGIKSKWVQVR